VDVLVIKKVERCGGKNQFNNVPKIRCGVMEQRIIETNAGKQQS
jgi:hypothetical protein